VEGLEAAHAIFFAMMESAAGVMKMFTAVPVSAR